MIYIYAACLIVTGLIGVAVHPAGILSSSVLDTPGSPAGMLLKPVAFVLALAAGGIYVSAIVSGIFIFLRRRWAMVSGIITQSAFVLTIPSLLGLILKHGGTSAGWEISGLNLYLYTGVYAMTVIVTIWYFTRAEVKEYFNRGKREPAERSAVSEQEPHLPESS